MRVRIQPSKAHGHMEAPPSKSMAHRLLICAGLAEGESVISNVDLSRDILTTLGCLQALGADVSCEKEKKRVTVRGIDIRSRTRAAELDCGECASTLRFMIPVCLTSGNKSTLTGSRTLFQRPLSVYEDICREQKLTYEKRENRLTVAGSLAAGEYVVPGNISSQFISGLLFILPLLEKDSTIRLIPPVESRPYIDMTILALREFGVTVFPEVPALSMPAAGTVPHGLQDKSRGSCSFREGFILRIPGGQRYSPRTDLRVEGDYSNAAFFEALNLLGSAVEIEGLDENSLQADKIYRSYFEKLRKGYAEADLSDCPDLGPVLMVLAAALHGGRFTGTRRLKIKESDRGTAMRQELEKMGVRMELSENEICIEPGIKPPGEVLDGHNDHRIVMALSVLLTRTGGTIRGAQAVAKSLPDFFERLKKLGIEADCDESDTA